MLVLLDPVLVLRDLAARLGILRSGLRDVGLAGLAIAKAHLGQAQRILLRAGVLARQPQALLKDADVDVGGRDLRGEAHQGIVVARDLGHQVGIGRLQRAAELAPQIELPGRADAELGDPEAVVLERWQIAALPTSCCTSCSRALELSRSLSFS
jgi:hypothetical protein